MSESAPPPRSPFASESWEPRFAIEGYELEAMRHAVGLWTISSYWSAYHSGPALIQFVARHDDYLLVAHPASDNPGYQDPWAALLAPLPIERLPEWVMTWLGTATYPERPWFDGGERKGFCVYWAHCGCAELRRNNFGGLVVLPKWFEVHK